MGALTYNEAKKMWGDEMNVCSECEDQIVKGEVFVQSGNGVAHWIEPQYWDFDGKVHFSIRVGGKRIVLCGAVPECEGEK